MKRTLLIFLAICGLFVLINLNGQAMADETSANAQTDVNASVSAQFAPDTVIDNSETIAVGSMLQTYTHNISSAKIPMVDYGKPINTFSIYRSASIFPFISREDLETFKSVIDKTNGKNAFKKLRKKIILRPVLIRTFSDSEKVEGIYFPSSTVLNKATIDQKEILGILFCDSKDNGKMPVLPPHLQMICGEESMDEGANVAIPIDDYFRKHFDAGGGEFSFSGLFSWLGLRKNPTGIAGSPHGGMTSQQNQMIGDAGAAFLLLRVKNPEKLWALSWAKPAPPQKKIDPCQEIRDRILARNENLINCPNPVPANALLRYEQGYDYLSLYNCTSNPQEAIQTLVLARDNFIVAIRDGADGGLLQNIHLALSGTYRVMFDETGKIEYQRQANTYAKKAGVSEPPVLMKGE